MKTPNFRENFVKFSQMDKINPIFGLFCPIKVQLKKNVPRISKKHPFEHFFVQYLSKFFKFSSKNSDETKKFSKN